MFGGVPSRLRSSLKKQPLSALMERPSLEIVIPAKAGIQTEAI
jgi:hypothetical protein